MMWDFAFGKSCDHRVLEEATLVVEDGRTLIRLGGQFDSSAPGFILYRNGVDVTLSVSITGDFSRGKTVYLQSSTPLISTTYPPYNYEIGYYSSPDACPKCFRKAL